ncbi:TadE family type IV pilus minor pilin [Blastococcus sp. SYSU D00695]
MRVRSPARCRSGREAGMVTAETAVVLPVLLLVLAGAVAAVTVVGAHLRCLDAAREGARAAARGDDAAAVRVVAAAAAPDGATTAVETDGDRVRVTVSADVSPLGPLPLTVTVRATAVAELEPGVLPAGEAGAGGGRG